MEHMTLLSQFQSAYHEPDSDPGFDDFTHDIDLDDDATLAELIDIDGRWRGAVGLPVELGRYHSVVTNLGAMPISLDAAIDVTLRWMSQSGTAEKESLNILIEQYPEAEPAIREALMLSHALWSTASLNANNQPRIRSLPTPLGPIMPDGRLRYELIQVLGIGAFGQVFMAIDRQLSEEDHAAQVAIKILHPSKMTPGDRHRITDEATKARRINHPNVVRVLDRGSTEFDEEYFVYELVEGGDLVSHVYRQRASLTRRELVELATQIARGVQAAHSAGVVHCDLKPSNIMITADGQPKVADFGIATHQDDARLNLEGGELQLLGSMAFMSPEQFRIEPGWRTVPSDIYSLGGILYFLLTKSLPNGETEEAVREALQADTARTEAPRLPEVDRDLETICRRAMEPRPENRYHSAGELAFDLDAWIARRPIAWTQPSIFRVMGLWTRRRPSVALATLAIIAVVLIGAFMINDHFQELAIHEVRLEQFQQALDLLGSEKKPAEEVHILFLLMLESSGPNFKDLPGMGDLVREKHIAFAKNQVAALEQGGFTDDFETAIWRSAIGMWLIADNRPEEAVAELERAVDSLKRKLDPSDSFVLYGEALLACARAGVLVKAAQQIEGLPDDIRGQLKDAASDLRRSDKLFLAHREHANARRFVLQAWADVLQPDMLDDPEELKTVEEALQWWDEE